MLFAKKIKQILLLVFLVSVLASCDKVCYEADQFYDKMHTIKANGIDHVNGDGGTRTITGKYNDSDGGQIIEWQKTGMIANGGYFMLAISGGWTDIAISDYGDKDQSKIISKAPSCRLCFKKAGTNNCLCGPILDDAQFNREGGVMWEVSESESLNTNEGQNNSTPGPDCNGEDGDNIDKCTCKKPLDDEKKDFFNNNNEIFHVFPRDAYKKTSTASDWSSARNRENRKDCAYKMGVGLYIGLIPSEKGSGGVPPVAYHLASQQVVCPIGLDSQARCIDDRGVDRTKVIYRSPGLRIFKQSKPGEPDVYHKLGDEVKLNIYDRYLSDDSGGYNVEFMRGVIAKEGDGIMADIVRSFDRYLFGANYFDEKLKIRIKKDGMVEFMYKAILQDSIVRSVISISLVMYICFLGLAFFMGMTDFGKKEIMMRLLKIGLVVLFTNANACLWYNEIIVTFFKNGMDTLVNMISGIFESNMELTVASVNLQGEGDSVAVDAGRKFIYSDKLIMDLVSTPTITKIFGLFWIKGKGFNFFALIYIPAILLLIIYFIYMVLDVALKYMINILKICIGLALGPVFILFSLFEKTKDMFNNWVAFVAARSLEIVILFAMLHPFLIILDLSFKEMLMFKVCSVDVGADLLKYSVWETENTGRGIYDWFQYFLKIAALIFITKSVCDRAGYISGQLISIGGIANADPVSQGGRGESGFNMASSITKGIFSLAKTAITNSKISQAGKFAGRVMIRNLTKAGRAGIGEFGSINDMVNNAFKAVGIRNRGLRSYMRDREVDNAFNLVSQEANQKGLEGKERDKYIRQEVNNRMDLFEGQNKNKASLLGLDPKNIKKRLDKKLIEEPLKKFIEQQGENLKNQGKMGKEARDGIKTGAEDWANQNLDLSKDEVNRKVSEFFKKTSVKGAMKSASEVTASQAAKYVKHLVSSDKIDEADKYKEKFRNNAVEGKIEKNKQREENKREGGVLFKGAVGLGKVVAMPVVSAIKLGKWAAGRDVNTDSSKIKENYPTGKAREFSGRFDNKVAKERDRFFGLLGYAGMDEEKDFRKFDRKLARELSNPETAEKIKKHNKDNEKTAFDSELSKAVDKKGRNANDEAFKKIEGGQQEQFNPIIQDRTILRFKEGESNLQFATKLAVKVVFSPLYIPANFARKKYNKVAGEGAEFKRLGRESQLSTLRKLAGHEAKEINEKLDAIHKQNLKVDKNTGVGKTDKEKTDALEQLKESKKHKDSIEKVIVMMKRMEKTARKQEKEEKQAFLDKEIKDKDFAERAKIFLRMKGKDAEEASAKADQVERLEKSGGKDTVFERLSKIEEIKEGNNLKSEYVKEVNRKINEIKDDTNINDLQKLEALEALKGDLFISMDDLERKPALKVIFEQVIKKDPVDIVSGNNALASTPAIAQVVNDSKPNSTEVKSEYGKQRQLLEDVYQGQKIIAEAEAQNSKVKEEKDIKEKEERDRSRNGDSPPVASAQTRAQAQAGAQTRAQDQGAQAPDPDKAQGAQAPAQGAQFSAQTQGARAQDDPAAGIENLKKENELQKNQAKVEAAIGSLVAQGVDYKDCSNIVRQIVANNPLITNQELVSQVLLILQPKK